MARSGLAASGWAGMAFIWFVALVAGLMVWELVRMLAPRDALLAVHLAAVAGAVRGHGGLLPAGLALPTLLIRILTGVVPMQATGADLRASTLT
jgi:phosphatidate cytidylyltransferase